MKLLNRSFFTISISLLLIIGLWSVVFYFVLLDEIYDNIDDGLEEYKEYVIDHAQEDNSLLQVSVFDERNFAIDEITGESADGLDGDFYTDTIIHRDPDEDPERMRMLTSSFEQDGQHYRLQIISSLVEEDDLIESFVIFLLILYAVVLFSIFVINNVLLRKLWKPFYRYLRELKNFRIDRDPENPKMKTNTLEFVQLNKACDELINYARDTYSRQKQFIENAAHELQTPLAVINSKLELLLEGNDLSREDAVVVVDVFHKVQQLSQMNRSLLLLSKIENKQFFDNQTVNVNEVVKKVIEQFEDFAKNKSIVIQLNESENLVVDFDPALMDILVSNLIKNAIVHNMFNGQIIIHVENDGFHMCNSSAIARLSDRIFERFYKDSSSNKGTGLGLAIAGAICKLYGLEILYSHDGMHCFGIKFK